MTTLPTREDGSLDEERLGIEDGCICVFRDGIKYLTLGEYTALIQAHTIERCAKVADDYVHAEDSNMVALVRDEIRKMGE